MVWDCFVPERGDHSRRDRIASALRRRNAPDLAAGSSFLNAEIVFMVFIGLKVMAGRHLYEAWFWLGLEIIKAP